MSNRSSAWRELSAAAQRLTRAAEAAMAEVVTMPDAHDLVTRLMQLVGSLNLLIIDGERARGESEARKWHELADLKSDFLRLATHELRRPLGLAHGYVAMILDGTFGEVPEQIDKAVRLIRTGNQQMAALLDGLAAITLLEDRAEALLQAPNPIGQLVVEAVAEIKAEAAARRIHIEQRLPNPDIEANVDRERMQIAVVNLLSNAVKISPGDSDVLVELTANLETVEIAVTDRGPGIDAANVAHLFDRWFRAPDANTPGLGLGLYIVRMIVELHGGRVEVDSTRGQGSTFTVLLPR